MEELLRAVEQLKREWNVCGVSEALQQELYNRSRKKRKWNDYCVSAVASPKKSEALSPEEFSISSSSVSLEKEVQKDSIQLDFDQYKAYIPKSAFHLQGSKVEVSCEGCGKSFTSAVNGHEAAYYKHCMEKCEEYRKLGRLRKCDDCKLIFINQMSLGIHFCKEHRAPAKPDWMSQGTYKNSRRVATSNTTKTVSCPACKKQFRASASNRQNKKELAYYVHCVEECKQYKALHLIRACDKCECIFLNKRSLGLHRCNKDDDATSNDYD